jgi:hypothetical protein
LSQSKSWGLLVNITYDPDKPAKTLAERQLDFEDAPLVFAGRHFQIEDDRQDYGETRGKSLGG